MTNPSILSRTERNRQFSNTSDISGISYLSQETQLTDSSDHSFNNTETCRGRRNLPNKRLSFDGSSRPHFDLGANNDMLHQLIQVYDRRSCTALNSDAIDSDQSTVVEGNYIHAIGKNGRNPPKPINEEPCNERRRPQLSSDTSITGPVTQRSRYVHGQVLSSHKRNQFCGRHTANGLYNRTHNAGGNELTNANTGYNRRQAEPRCLQHDTDHPYADLIPQDSNENCKNCRNLQRHAESYPQDVATDTRAQAILPTCNTWPNEIVENPLDEDIDSNGDTTNLKRFQSSNEWVSGGMHSYVRPGEFQSMSPSSGTTPLSANVDTGEHTVTARQYKSLRRWLVGLACINVILILCTAVLIWFVFATAQINMICCTDGTQTTTSSPEALFKTCVNPEYIERKFQLHESEMHDILGLDVLPSDGVCFRTMTQVMALLDKVLKRMNLAGNQSVTMRSLLHVHGKGGNYAHTVDFRAGATISYNLKWSHESAGRIQRGGIKLSSDGIRLTVSSSGYYFVYNRVHFRFHKSQNQTRKAVSISHSIMKEGTAGETELDMAHQNCWLDGQNVEHTSVLETLVYLTADESVFVKLKGISTGEHLEKNGRKHKFGLFSV